MIRRRAPGKLFIAGEYAVVEPGHHAVLVAVDRFITVEIRAAGGTGGTGHVISDHYPGHCLTWRRGEDGTILVGEQPEAEADDYVVSAIRTVEQVACEAQRPLTTFDLEVSSELDDHSGRKLGLGSSAAVCVATVRAVAGWYDLLLDDVEVYKLALLASDAVQPIGSGGDIAASTLTGWVGYASPDRAWLRRSRQRMPASALMRSPWPHLELRRLPAPNLDLHVGWTGSPASTPHLVAGVSAHASSDDAWAGFLRESESCLTSLMQALQEHDPAMTLRQVAYNRTLLEDVHRRSGTRIETPALRHLIEIAHDAGAVAKSSGAGGGDCGIALCGPQTNAAALRAAWRTAGIEPLDLSVYSSMEVTS